MANTSEVMEVGLPWLGGMMLGADVTTAVTAAGSAQADATALTSAFVEVGTAAASTGIRLQPDGIPSFYAIFNGGANAVKVYPPVGSFMNGTVNAAFSVTNAKTAFIFRSGNRYIGVLSA
jgi:hypothetical protein